MIVCFLEEYYEQKKYEKCVECLLGGDGYMLELHKRQDCSTVLFLVSEKKDNHAPASNKNQPCTLQAFYRNFLQN